MLVCARRPSSSLSCGKCCLSQDIPRLGVLRERNRVCVRLKTDQKGSHDRAYVAAMGRGCGHTCYPAFACASPARGRVRVLVSPCSGHQQGTAPSPTRSRSLIHPGLFSQRQDKASPPPLVDGWGCWPAVKSEGSAADRCGFRPKLRGLLMSPLRMTLSRDVLKPVLRPQGDFLVIFF